MRRELADERNARATPLVPGLGLHRPSGKGGETSRGETNQPSRTGAVPRPSLCLNIPKTGSGFTTRFFDAADWLEFKRRLGRYRLAVPNWTTIRMVRRIKRYGPARGNLSSRSWDHHAGYSSLPSDLRRHAKLCALRDVNTWYCSYYLYYTTVMRDTLLSRAIRLLVD